MLREVVETNYKTGEVIRRLVRAAAFAEAHPNLVHSYATLRRQIHHRHQNGMTSANVCVESRYGILIDPERYQSWVLEPNQAREAA